VPSVVSLRRYIKVAPRLPPLNRKTILMRDIGVCQYCSKIAENIDHIIPRSKGGGTTWENCVAACKNCNSRKGANYLKDMPGMKLKKQPGPPSALSWVHAAVWKVHVLPCQSSFLPVSQKLREYERKMGTRSGINSPICTVLMTLVRSSGHVATSGYPLAAQAPSPPRARLCAETIFGADARLGMMWHVQVDPRWKPYVGELCWEDIEKTLRNNSKKLGKRISQRNGKNLVSLKVKMAQAAVPVDRAGLGEADLQSVIAAYTGGQ